MGLDLVEIVMRCEEVFAIDLPDWKCERVRTVGDLYNIVCEGLALTPLESPPRPTGPLRIFLARSSTLSKPWTPEDVWTTLVAIVTDELQVDEVEVTYVASFQEDLRCD